MNSSQVYEFSIPGFATQRKWCVYIVIAFAANSEIKRIYVGKVGDNRNGCNPIVSRIGNHLSHNKIHSQLRNKLGDTTDFDYKIHFATFGEYTESNKQDRDKINELERQLNRLVQRKIENNESLKLENPFRGRGYIATSLREYRRTLLTEADHNLLHDLANNALK